jgi:hypothetical protein
MDRNAIATAVRRYLNEFGRLYVTGTIMRDHISEAQSVLNIDTNYKRADITIGLQTGVREYALPATSAQIHRVRLGTAKVKLDPTTKDNLDNTREGWESATGGTPIEYYAEGMIIGVYPKPHAAASATVMHINCTSDVSDLANGTSSPSWLPSQYHRTIAKGAAIGIATGYDAENKANMARLEKLVSDYNMDVQALRLLADNRSVEYQATITPRTR